MDYQKLFQSEISRENIGAWRASGRKAVGVVCGHVPLEIFHGADVLPVRLRATGCEEYSGAEVWMTSFGCSFAKSILQYLIDGVYDLDGLVASDGCMLAVRIYDNWKYICEKEKKEQFICEIGAPRKFSPTTREFYEQEITELKERLEKLTGNTVTKEKIVASIKTYNEARRLLGQVMELRKAKEPVISGADALTISMAATNMPIEEYIQLLKAFLADAGSRKPITGHRARLMLIGSAIDNPEYLKIIENKGGLIVADELCLGSLMLGDEIPLDESDPIGSLAEYYLSRVVCPRMVDNRDKLHQHVIDKALEYGCDGVVYEKMQNCECWGGENYFLEPALKENGLPILNVEREQKLANAGQLEIRAEAFIEMIEKEG